MSISEPDANRSGTESEPRRLVEDLPESPETYWRWGIPSLVLGTLTVVLGLASQFFVQPRVVARYEQIVKTAMERERSEAISLRDFGNGRGLGEKGAIARGTGAKDAVETDSAAAIHEQIEFLKNAELAAQRLVVEQPSNSEHRYAAGRIALSASAYYWKLASLTGRSEDETERITYEQSAMAARDRGEDAMRSAQRLPGVGSMLAEKWSIREQLNRTRLFSEDAAASLESVLVRLEVLHRENPDDREWLRLLGQARMLLALCPLRAVSEDERIASVEQAEKEFQKYLETDSHGRDVRKGMDFVDRVWLAEAIAVRDRALAAERAKESLVLRHAEGAHRGVGGLGEETPETIDAMFRALLYMGSAEEAFAAFESRRDQVDLPERSTVQSLVASSCVRAAVMGSLGLQGRNDGLNDGKLVRLVMRLAPQSSDARALMDAWVNGTPRVGKLFESEHENDSEHDRALAIVIRWLRLERKAALAGGDAVSSRVFPEGWTLRQSDIEVLVGVIPTLMEWVRKKEMASRRALDLLDAMQGVAPENLDLVYASAILALQARHHDRAISDLRRLLEALPGNAQLERLLLAAYENAAAARSQTLKEREQGVPDAPLREVR